MYPYYRSPYLLPDQRFIGGWGLGWPLAVGGLGFLGGLIGGGLIGGALASRPFFGYPGFGYPGMGFGGYPYMY